QHPAVALSQTPPLSELEAKYLKNVRQVTRGMEKAGEGYFSPDGKSIIYQAVPPGYPFYQIYTQPLPSGEPQRISTGRGRTTCSFFSPDARFSSTSLPVRTAAVFVTAQRRGAEQLGSTSPAAATARNSPRAKPHLQPLGIFEAYSRNSPDNKCRDWDRRKQRRNASAKAA
ncbi:MAG: TolB family protein, partial [Planctomycetota bacterium]